MLYIKNDYPEINELVYCKVTKILGNTTFLKLEEYDKEAILVISEVSPGRIRSLFEFVQVGKFIVCKVLKVNPQKKQTEVSLRRVSIPQKKQKLEFIKKEEFCKVIFKDASKSLDIDYEKFFDKMSDFIFDSYESVYECFLDIAENNKILDNCKGLSSKEKESLLNIINQKIKKESFKLKSDFQLVSFNSDGINAVKKVIDMSLEKSENDISVTYLGSGTYTLKIEGSDKKIIDNGIKNILKNIEENSKKNNCVFSLKKEN